LLFRGRFCLPFRLERPRNPLFLADFSAATFFTSHAIQATERSEKFLELSHRSVGPPAPFLNFETLALPTTLRYHSFVMTEGTRERWQSERTGTNEQTAGI